MASIRSGAGRDEPVERFNATSGRFVGSLTLVSVAVIVGYVRTPFGRHAGALAKLRPDSMAGQAISALVERTGIDTASVDYGPSRDFPVHQLLNGAGLYALENVAQLDQVPPTGATIIALPLKIRGGSGGPVRIIALLP